MMEIYKEESANIPQTDVAILPDEFIGANPVPLSKSKSNLQYFS